MRSKLVLLGPMGAAFMVACSASRGGLLGITGGAGGSGGEGGSQEASAQTTGTTSSGDDDIPIHTTGASGGATNTGCNSGPNEDKDKDGFTVKQGDCNDCDANVNPGAIEVIAEAGMDGKVPPAVDEDCDGKIDNVVVSCDDNLALTDTDPFAGSSAIDLCQKATAADKKWGILDAHYVRADGTVMTNPGYQVGIQSTFGTNVKAQRGASLLALSSGHARTKGQGGACLKDSCSNNFYGTAPQGFPQPVMGCDVSEDINDDVGLELRLRAPTNATGYTFDFFFYTFEYPKYICQRYNDQFIALVDPPPLGSINGNISFDSKHNPVSVNIAYFSVCEGCARGTSELAGTGFDTWGAQTAGATGWLKTQAPVKGGEEVKIRFAIWDTYDSYWDSTVLIDNFRWIASGGTVPIGTVPTEPPR